jgi:hypothetical protein
MRSAVNKHRSGPPTQMTAMLLDQRVIGEVEFGTSAPIRRPPPVVSSTVLSGSREMSISRDGRSTSSFIKSIRCAACDELCGRIGGNHPHRLADIVCPCVLKIDHDLPPTAIAC